MFYFLNYWRFKVWRVPGRSSPITKSAVFAVWCTTEVRKKNAFMLNPMQWEDFYKDLNDIPPVSKTLEGFIYIVAHHAILFVCNECVWNISFESTSKKIWKLLYYRLVKINEFIVVFVIFLKLLHFNHYFLYESLKEVGFSIWWFRWCLFVFCRDWRFYLGG